MQQVILNGIELSELLSSVRGIIKEEVSSLNQSTISPISEEYCSPKEISKEFKISTVTFYDWLKKGFFPVYKMGNRTFVKRSEFIKAFHKIDLKKQ